MLFFLIFLFICLFAYLFVCLVNVEEMMSIISIFYIRDSIKGGFFGP